LPEHPETERQYKKRKKQKTCRRHETVTHPALKNVDTYSKHKLQMYNRDGRKRWTWKKTESSL